MEEFVVDRSKWLSAEVRRAAGIKSSCLLDSDNGLMCCLGQYGLHRGVKAVALADVASPQDLDAVLQSAFPDVLFNKQKQVHARWPDSDDSLALQRVNDGIVWSEAEQRYVPDTLSAAEREQCLVELFSKLDIKLSFRGDPSIAVVRALDTVSRKGDTTLVA